MGVSLIHPVGETENVYLYIWVAYTQCDIPIARSTRVVQTKVYFHNKRW